MKIKSNIRAGAGANAGGVNAGAVSTGGANAGGVNGGHSSSVINTMATNGYTYIPGISRCVGL
jgi:hypothetical protein